MFYNIKTTHQLCILLLTASQANSLIKQVSFNKTKLQGGPRAYSLLQQQLETIWKMIRFTIARTL